MPMPKSTTHSNSEELFNIEENNTKRLKKEIVNSILNFSRSLQVRSSKAVETIEFNLN